MPDLNFTLSGDNLTLTTVGGEKLVQTGDFSWSLVDGAQETVEYLPALTTPGASYHAVYSTRLLVAAYTGPLLRVIRNSDSTEVDVFPVNGTIPPAVIAGLRGTGTEVRIVKWYDQSGNGRDATQTVANRRPALHEDAYWNGAPVILHDGGVNFIGGPQGRGFDFTHALTGRASAEFAVTDFKASTQTQFLFAYDGSAGGDRVVYHNYTGNSSIVEDNANGPISTWIDKQFPARMAVQGWCEKVGPLDYLLDGVTYEAKTSADNLSPGSTPTAETLTTGKLGYTTAGGFASYQPNMRLTTYLTINGASPSNADRIAVTRALQSNFAIPLRFDSRFIIIGDSIAEGGANTLTLELMWYLRQQSIKGTPEPWNEGISGKTLAQCYADRALFDHKLYKAGIPNVFILQGGSNDINDGVSATTLYATTTSYVSYLKGLGSNVKVVVGTILKRGDYSGAKETERAAYNALVAGNAAGADGIWDPHAALTAVDPNYVTNTAILGDLSLAHIHPSSYGYSLLAPSLAAAINLVLP